MKTTLKRITAATIALLILSALGIALRAQTNNQTDLDNPLRPVDPADLPESAAFFRLSDYLAYDGSLGPPWPFLMTNAPVYTLNGNTFLVDDAAVTNDDELINILSLLVQPQDQFSTNLMSANSIDPTDGDTNTPPGGWTNNFQWSPLAIDTNGLWIELPTNSLAISGQYALILHNTLEGEPYDILMSTNLLLSLTQWTVETSVLGATNGDFTPLQLAINGRSNLFVAARFGGISDDSGIPDWWQLRYFGQTGLDPNDDPDGDGWSNVQEFENGTDPHSFDTPPPPHILSATVDSGGNIHVTWAPGGGPVAQYAIENISVTTNTVSQSTFDGTVPAEFEYGESDFGEPTVQVEALYSGGLAVPSQRVQVGNYGPNLNVQFFRGPGARLYFAVQAAPANLSKVRVIWYTTDEGWHYSEVYATNLVHGIAEVPLDIYSGGYSGGGVLDYQLYFTDGTFGPVTRDFVYFANEEADPFASFSTNFVSQARQMKENLKFLLRSATVTTPFSYASAIDTADNDLGHPAWIERQAADVRYTRPQSSTNYEYYGFHVFVGDYNYSAMDDVRPVKENSLWSNFAYSPLNFDGTGSLTNGPTWEYDNLGLPVRELYHPAVRYIGSGTQAPLPLPLSTTNSTWIYRESFASLIPAFDEDGISTPAAQEFELYPSGASTILPASVRNCYGLFLNSLEIGTNTVVYPGADLSAVTAHGQLFMNFEAPGLRTVDYYFAGQTPYLLYSASNSAPIPGCTNFTTTNVAPPIIAGFNQRFGNLITVSAWAKQEITNGYAGKYAYLEQYLDKAYQIDASGNVTTNEAGLISPYGEFFPMVPGRQLS